jgi:hypothetical protein
VAYKFWYCGTVIGVIVLLHVGWALFGCLPTVIIWILHTQSCPCIHQFSVRGLLRPEKNLKIVQINGHKFQNAHKVRTGHNMVKSNSPNVASSWLIYFTPVLTLPHSTYLHSASSILTVLISCCDIAVFVFSMFVTWISHFHSIRYYLWFHITTLGLGTYYLWIWGYTCITKSTH